MWQEWKLFIVENNICLNCHTVVSIIPNNLESLNLENLTPSAFARPAVLLLILSSNITFPWVMSSYESLNLPFENSFRDGQMTWRGKIRSRETKGIVPAKSLACDKGQAQKIQQDLKDWESSCPFLCEYTMNNKVVSSSKQLGNK